MEKLDVLRLNMEGGVYVERQPNNSWRVSVRSHDPLTADRIVYEGRYAKAALEMALRAANERLAQYYEATK